ncbi:MAG TPA: helical backbone metal receptor, partial [Planctomycetota bacterium]|nr:helical backbone metal receptor [Planctomycetota bacterium]
MTKRLVSLCPSTTELIFQLGAGNQLVGITDWCIHPKQGVAAIEKVGGTKNPDVERIARLKPDLVFLNEEENRLEDCEALRAHGLRLHLSFPKTVEASVALIRSVGAAIERTDEAEALAARIESEVLRIARLAKTVPPVRYAYLIWRKPWMVAGGDTGVYDAIMHTD